MKSCRKRQVICEHRLYIPDLLTTITYRITIPQNSPKIIKITHFYTIEFHSYPPPPEFFKSYRRIFVLWVVFPSSGQDKYTKIFRAAIKPGKFEIATMDTNNDVLTTKRFFSRIQLFPYHMATFFWNLQSLVLFPAENAAIFIMFRWTDNPTLSIFYVH